MFNDNTQQYDRITEILQRGSPANEQQMVNSAIASELARTFAGNPGNMAQVVYEAQQQPLKREMDILSVFEAKKAAGDQQAKALDAKINLFTGGDPEGTALFLQELHSDPENIDPSNAYQVMTKLAGIAKRTGYQSPTMQAEKMKGQLEAAKTQSEIEKNLAMAEKYRGGGAIDPFTGQPVERKLSATEQKELFDTTDLINSGTAARSALEQAKNILTSSPAGAEPYTGFGAETRAGAARIPVIGDIIADKERGAATTEYKTLVTEQALNNLKAIFGGMPTEGERQILMDMQALPSYTPAEQQRILDNATKAVERRIQFNQQKAEMITTGRYSKAAETGSQQAEETRTIGDKTYVKIGGKWHEQ